jgi:hypothetical protein
MKRKITLLTILFISLTLFSQDKIDKISRDSLVGQRIKFLLDNDNEGGYQYFGKSGVTYPYLDYEEYKQRTATIIQRDKNIFTLKMDDDGEIIYFKIYDFENIPNYVGILSLLDSAKTKYLNKSFFNKNLEKCKIVDIEFAEDEGKFSQLYGPFNVKYLIEKDTTMINVHFSETYGPIEGYEYEYQKERLFSNIFIDKDPFTPLTKENIGEKFYVDIDKMDGKKIYIHKNLINQEYIKYNLGYFLDYNWKNILSEVTLINGIPKIVFMSNFTSSDWLFHTYIKIKIGNVTKQTRETTGIREVLKGGRIVERNTYNSITDLQILKWISENYNKEILVRFYGKDYYDDITLSTNDKLALKETYELYTILKQ